MKKISLYLQLLLSIAVIVMLVLVLVNKINLGYLELVLGIDLFTMAYNNYKFYKRQNFTVYYLVFGIVMIILSILKLLGVI